MAKIVWFISDRELVVQFRDIGEQVYFTTILAQFKALGKVRWLQNDRSWSLSVEDFPDLVRFADRQGLRLIWAGRTKSPIQMPLL